MQTFKQGVILDQVNKIKKATVYTDGACKGNPGPGGWGCVIYLDHLPAIEIGGSSSQTTNNKMELTAPIQALSYLEALKIPIEQIEILSDSTYVIQGITQWISSWKRKNWISSSGSAVANQDLWQSLDARVQTLRQIGTSLKWTKVLAHSGIDGNERADAIASARALDLSLS